MSCLFPPLHPLQARFGVGVRLRAHWLRAATTMGIGTKPATGAKVTKKYQIQKENAENV